MAKRHIRDLSGGQQQRVFLARALIAQPDLLVLDEPTSGVDMRTAENVLHLLADLNRQGITILMTTHDLNAAAAHLPWVICLNRRVIAEGHARGGLYRGDPQPHLSWRDDGDPPRRHDLDPSAPPSATRYQDMLPNPVLGHSPACLQLPAVVLNGATGEAKAYASESVTYELAA